MLAGYWSGVPSLERHGRFVPRGLWDRLMRYEPLTIQEYLCRWIPAPVLIRNISRRLFSGELGNRFDYFACRVFDRRVSRELNHVNASAVSACEISALNTFQKAKSLGWKTILDAPQVHHLMLDRCLPQTEGNRLHERIRRVKDAEIGLADHIITVSELARQSYIEGGSQPEKVHCVELGADVDLFRSQKGNGPKSEGPCRFIFAGAVSFRKGVDILIESFRSLRARRDDVELMFAGPAGDAYSVLKGSGIPGIEFAGPMKQERLACELSSAHCLVLPSRLDSYGMVVTEALACGTPVIVTKMVGAASLVNEGGNGWVIPNESPETLTKRMIWCCDHLSELLSMREACRESAMRATWERYSTAYVELMRRVL